MAYMVLTVKYVVCILIEKLHGELRILFFSSETRLVEIMEGLCEDSASEVS